MKVHAVLQTGEAATIGTGLAVELDGASIGQDQPRPGEQDAGLPGANLSVIVTDQPRALRDQQDAARGAVINILRNLRGDLARQVRADAGDQRRRNNAACLSTEEHTSELQTL